VIHIDFGDCFEVAMHRKSFPEKVPFRLTRMLIAAMEVSGVEGNFRYTCESVMQVLRNNRDSVIALLQAFIYDPLINWRLLATKEDSDKEVLRSTASTSSFYGNASPHSFASTPMQKSGNAAPGSTASVKGKLVRSSSSPSNAATEMDNDKIGSMSNPHGPSEDVLSQATSLSSAMAHNSSTLSQHLQSVGQDPSYQRPRALTEGRFVALPELGTSSGKPSITSMARNQQEKKMVQQADNNAEVLNQRALDVLQRVHDKLTGMDFAVPRDQASDVDLLFSPQSPHVEELDKKAPALVS
jgi:phosphatidylinositol kinase/protein kinase (PI-3  family)